MDTTHVRAQAQRSGQQRLQWLLSNADQLLQKNPQYCPVTTMFRPMMPKHLTDRKGSGILVEKTSSHSDEHYDIKSSGIAPQIFLEMTDIVEKQLGQPTVQAVDEFGRNVHKQSSEAYAISAHYPNGVQLYWTADLGNRFNLHCPTRAAFSELNQFFALKEAGQTV